MAGSVKFAGLTVAINAGLGNIHKWYGTTDDTDAYFVCLGNANFSLRIGFLY